MPADPAPNGRKAPIDWGVAAIGLYQVLLSLLLLGLLFALWPERLGREGGWQPTLQIGLWRGEIGDDARLILIVLCTGALGSHVHAATSFATFVGNRRLRLSWAWWYVLRPFIGMALALIFYFVVRGGLLSTGSAASDISAFGIAAVAGLVGMFAKQATDKLRELFDNLFRTEQGAGDDARIDKLGADLPVGEVMLARKQISVHVIAKGKTAAAVKLTALYDLVRGQITRVPVLDPQGMVVCIIHQSLLYKFLADRSIQAVGQEPPFNADRYTLEDFLQEPGMVELVKDSLVYVKPDRLLSEAKDDMERVPNCQDIVVTENGRDHEPMLGWLTDADLRRASKIV